MCQVGTGWWVWVVGAHTRAGRREHSQSEQVPPTRDGLALLPGHGCTLAAPCWPVPVPGSACAF